MTIMATKGIKNVTRSKKTTKGTSGHISKPTLVPDNVPIQSVVPNFISNETLYSKLEEIEKLVHHMILQHKSLIEKQNVLEELFVSIATTIETMQQSIETVYYDENGNMISTSAENQTDEEEEVIEDAWETKKPTPSSN